MNVTVNISFQDALLEQIDAEAKRESRSRSELLREAARMYIKRQQRLEAVFAMGDAVREKQGFTAKDIEAEIAALRNGQ
ncbi:MAG: ribbon-helix-helix domain-containing protein [Kiritimatiellales bacterium]|nr:ribbon-helix-helix domain-containing protein [Kiritimatiellales bacterium]MCF7863358.1 ribbon-helix-helix domain-containing protein [Kiritimatiellales bacterium]